MEFFDHLPKELRTIDVTTKFTHQQLEVAMANYQGVAISVFGATQVMDRILRPAIDDFRAPAEMTLEQVGQILREIVAYATAETKV